MPKLKPGWRIRLSNFEKGLVVNADTEMRARELALLWAKDKIKDSTATIISCERMADDDIYIVEGGMWRPGDE